MLTFLKIIKTVFIICLIVQFLIIGFFLWANFTSAAKEPRGGNTTCWTKEECDEAEGQWGKSPEQQQLDQKPEQCKTDEDFLGKDLEFCYPMPQETILSVAIGGVTTTVTDLSDYIIKIYKYLLGIAGILATIMVVVSGVLWLTAGGNTQQITTAKSYISNVLVGLVLLFGAHFLLQTINPALVRLEMPRMPMIRQKPFVAGLFGCADYKNQEDCKDNPKRAAGGCIWVENKCVGAGTGERNNPCKDDKCTGDLVCTNIQEGVLYYEGYSVCIDGESGSLCGKDEHCKKEKGLKCIDKICTTGTNKALGMPCKEDQECASGFCAKGFSPANCATGEDGSPCLNDKDCKPKFQCTECPGGASNLCLTGKNCFRLEEKVEISL